jgi:hypothetical protein
MRQYLRFRTNLPADDAATLVGVFWGLARLNELDAMDPWSAERAAEVCDWFNRHLPVPRLRCDRHAVFWLRAECRDFVQRFWDLAGVLRENDVAVELLRTNNPGRVCYQDRFQVAAIPWRCLRNR